MATRDEKGKGVGGQGSHGELPQGRPHLRAELPPQWVEGHEVSSLCGSVGRSGERGTTAAIRKLWCQLLRLFVPGRKAGQADREVLPGPILHPVLQGQGQGGEGKPREVVQGPGSADGHTDLETPEWRIDLMSRSLAEVLRETPCYTLLEGKRRCRSLLRRDHQGPARHPLACSFACDLCRWFPAAKGTVRGMAKIVKGIVHRSRHQGK